MKHNHVLILEGPDGAGKTTLAQHLVSHHGYEYWHNEAPKPGDEVLQLYAKQLIDACQQKKSVVIDRLHWGEYVYGGLIRGVDKLGLPGIKLISRILRAQRIYTLYCKPPLDIVRSNWHARYKDEYVKREDQLVKIYQRYEELAAKVTENAYHTFGVWDYTTQSLDLTAQVLTSNLVRIYPRLPFTVIGSPEAKFLFVGEIANHPWLDLPFFALNASSEFLNDSLQAAGYTESEICLTNVKRLDGFVQNIAELSGDRHVVCLGLRASELTNVANRVTVHHPAYWKRFHAHRQDTYIDALRKIRIDYYANYRPSVRPSLV